MPKTRRSNCGTSGELSQKAKRHCESIVNGNGSSTSSLWSESEGSFLTTSKIDELFSDSLFTPASPRNATTKNRTITNFYNSTDDNLFSDIYVPESSESEENVGGTPIELVLPGDIDENDSLFQDVDLGQFADKEAELDENIFQDDTLVENKNDNDIDVGIQNTQKFLLDVGFKIPSIPKGDDCKKKYIDKNESLARVMGTQYDTHEELVEHTQKPSSNQLAEHILPDISFCNWDSQLLPEPDPYYFPSKGDFYGLPDRIKQMIFEHKGIRDLYEWQKECLGLPAIKKRKNLIYALPTSGGKTLVAEILMLREIICREKNVLFILPYVSIVQEKVAALSPFAIACDFIVDEYTAGRGKCPPVARKKRRSIFVASIEKGAVLFDSLIEAHRANEIGLVVIDELHLIGEKGRGATLETLLTKVMFINASIQIVGMSATIGNLSEISQFMQADVYTRGFRPVELKEYIKCGNDILEVNPAGHTPEEIYLYKRTVDFKYSASVLRADPDHLAGLVSECAPDNCCLIFCPSRKNCESVAVLLSKILPKNKFLEHRKSEKADLMDALDKVCGILSPILAKTIPFGIAYHHSGLTTDERRFIETGYRFGVVSVICCTSTLAAGVNLPAKRVIIRSPYVGAEFMTLCKYKQMVGRAGRAGMGDETGESILIAASRDNARISDMLFSPMDKAVSSLNCDEGIGLQSLILSAIGLELANCRQDLYCLIDSTLLAVQNEHLDISPHELVVNILRQMFKNKVLQLSSTNANAVDILTSQDNFSQNVNDKCSQEKRPLVISRSTRFELTDIGKAAFKAGIDYKRTYVVYNEIKLAQKQLILSSYGHLLYLIICFNSNSNGDELFAADASRLLKIYPQLDETTQLLLRQLGFTEVHLSKIAKTLSIHGPLELTINRFFKTLVLIDVLNLEPLPKVAAKFDIERGILQNLISQSTAAASALVRLCEQVAEFWCFQPLFERLLRKIDRCGTAELEPLLDLPAVKINRAKQLYSAGFKTIESIARCHPIDLVKSVEHLGLRVAKEIVSAAKIIIMKKLDFLEEETEALKICLRPDDSNPNQ